MDFAPSAKVGALRQKLAAFMERFIYPNERTYGEQIEASGDRHHRPKILEELKAKAKDAALWNLFLPDPAYGAGLTNLEYAPLAEVMGRVLWASEVFNCSAPDTGNMEILTQFGAEAQKKQWLEPLLDGRIRSGFSMTEPMAARPGPTPEPTNAVRDGSSYVITGRKWFTTGAMHAAVFIVVAVTDANAPRHRRVSLLLVPRDRPGVAGVG